MKKSIVALAVAGALTAPMVAQADATLYGSLRIKVTSYDGQELDVANNVSRVGIKGSHETFDGSKAFFQFEEGVDTDAATRSGRLALIGLSGDFGTFQIGRMWTAHYLFNSTLTDILDNRSSGLDLGFTRSPNVMAYITPNMGGFQAVAAVISNYSTTAATTVDVMDATGTKIGTATTVSASAADGEDLDMYNLVAKYSMGGATVSASWVDSNTVNRDTWAVGASYSDGPMYVGARYQDDDINHANAGEEFSIAGSYTVGNTTLLANYIDMEKDKDATYSIEMQQKLSKQSRVFFAYSDVNNNSGMEFGYRVDF